MTAGGQMKDNEEIQVADCLGRVYSRQWGRFQNVRKVAFRLPSLNRGRFTD